MLIVCSCCLFPYQMRSEVVPTDSSSTRSSSSRARKMLPTTTPVAITPSARSLSTSCWIGSASLLTSALVCKDSSSSTPSGVVLALDLHPFSWSVSPWTTARSLSSSLPSTLLPRFPPLLLSPTTQSSPPTLPWSTLTAPSW